MGCPCRMSPPKDLHTIHSFVKSHNRGRKPGGGGEAGRHPPERWRRRCLVATWATLPQKWPPPPWNVAGSCQWTQRGREIRQIAHFFSFAPRDGLPLSEQSPERPAHDSRLRWLNRCGQFTQIGHIPGRGGHFCGCVARSATRQGILDVSSPTGQGLLDISRPGRPGWATLVG